MFQLILCWCFLLQGQAAKNDPNAPRSIIEKAILAHGGKEKLDAMRESTWKGKGLIYLKQDAQPSSVHGEWMMNDSPTKYRYVARLVVPKGLIPITTVLNEDNAWRQLSDEAESADIVELKKDEEKDLAHAWYLQRITPLLDEAYKLESLGQTRRGDRSELAVIGVKAEREGFSTMKLYFLKSNSQLVCLEFGVQDPEKSGNQLMRWTFSNYREFKGAKLSTFINVKRNSTDMFDFKLDEIKSGCDSNAFNKPMPKKRPEPPEGK